MRKHETRAMAWASIHHTIKGRLVLIVARETCDTVWTRCCCQDHNQRGLFDLWWETRNNDKWKRQRENTIKLLSLESRGQWSVFKLHTGISLLFPLQLYYDSPLTTTRGGRKRKITGRRNRISLNRQWGRAFCVEPNLLCLAALELLLSVEYIALIHEVAWLMFHGWDATIIDISGEMQISKLFCKL